MIIRKTMITNIIPHNIVAVVTILKFIIMIMMITNSLLVIKPNEI